RRAGGQRASRRSIEAASQGAKTEGPGGFPPGPFFVRPAGRMSAVRREVPRKAESELDRGGCCDRHDCRPRRAPRLGACLGTSADPSEGVQGLPVRSRMYCRIIRRTTWEGVESSSTHSCSNSVFLRGSMRIVRRALRSSIAKLVILRTFDALSIIM